MRITGLTASCSAVEGLGKLIAGALVDLDVGQRHASGAAAVKVAEGCLRATPGDKLLEGEISFAGLVIKRVGVRDEGIGKFGAGQSAVAIGVGLLETLHQRGITRLR